MIASTMSPSLCIGSIGGPVGSGIGATVCVLSVHPILTVINMGQ